MFNSNECSSATGLVRQIEFYFGDSNFRTDRFLSEKAKENKEGYVDISLLLTFQRMKQLTTDAAVVAAALADSEVVALNEEKTAFRRRKPLPEVDDSLQRSVFVSGMKDSTDLEALEEGFGAFGKVAAVRMRKNRSQKFFGECFVEFFTVEDAEKFVALFKEKGGATTTEALGAEATQILAKKEWFAQMKEKRNKAQYVPGQIVKVDGLGQKKEEKKEEEKKEEEKKEGKKEEEKKEEEKKEEEKKGEAEEEKKGEGDAAAAAAAAPISREDLSDELLVDMTESVAFIDYQRGDKTAHIRFRDAESATKAVEKINAEGRTVCGVKPTIALLEGEDEAAYWKHVEEAKRGRRRSGGRNDRRKSGGRGRGYGGGGGRGKRDSDRKRKREGDGKGAKATGESATKVAKTE